MNRLIILVLLHFMFFPVRAQPSIGPGGPTSQNFQPSVGIVIAILSVMFSVTLLLLVYAKFCHRPGPAHGDLPQSFAFIRSSSRFSGIDKTVIESLPFFRFSSLKGSKEGLECAVCLSKFEDIEMLRLLPKCKHAFHIACIDNWLEKHASCPICRHRVSAEDPTIFTYTHSMRLMNQPELQGEEANIGLFVQREEEEEEDHHHHRGSSRFSIGSSFRKAVKGNNKEEVSLIQEEAEEQKALHKHKHKIVVSDFVFKNRWSSVSSSDLMFLNSEMLTSVSSNRFSCLDSNIQQSSSSGAAENAQIVKIKEEMEMKRSFESKISALNKTSLVSFPDLPSTSSYMSPRERRSMSEITALSRYEDSGMQNRIRETSLLGNNVKEERLRRLWLPIAKRTVQWYANRDRRSQQPQKTQQTLDV